MKPNLKVLCKSLLVKIQLIKKLPVISGYDSRFNSQAVQNMSGP